MMDSQGQGSLNQVGLRKIEHLHKRDEERRFAGSGEEPSWGDEGKDDSPGQQPIMIMT